VNPVRHLARRLAGGGPVEDREWASLLATAERFGLAPALWVALAPSLASAPMRRDRLVLQRAFAANEARMADLLDQCEAIVTALAAAGIVAVPLKGADAVLAGRYPTAGARTMTDIDLLVPGDDAPVAEEVLADLGYRIQPAPPSSHQRPPRALPGHPGSVELHTALLIDRWSPVLAAADVLARVDGGRLDRTDAATHLVAHAQLQDEAHLLAQVPLRALHETALLLRGDEAVDWPRVRSAFARADATRALDGHLALTEALFGVASPLPLPRAERARATLVIAAARSERRARRVAEVRHLPRTLAADESFGARLRHVGRGLRRRWGKIGG
jgi:hypothetical protein